MSEKNTVALNERDSSSLLSSCGVRMVASVLLDKPDRAAFEAASRQLGFPVAMKVLSDDILHKTDVGCVVLNVTDVDGMQAAYDTIMANAAKNAPGARVQGVLAEQMLPKGFEVLLGVSTDPQFGHVIMAGLGGVLVELLHAVSLRVLPITRQDAEDMIDETPLAKACQGLRGQQYRREEIVEALMCLSRLVEEHPEITAAYAIADVVAIGAMRAAQDAGRTVGKDLSIIGFDGLALGEYLTPRLATIGQSVERLAREATGTLLDAIENGAPARRVTVPFTVISGESVGLGPGTQAKM